MNSDYQHLKNRLGLLLANLNPGAFIRYAIIGVLQNAAFYSVLLVLISFGWYAWQALIVVTPIATAVTFWANRAWTFSGRARNKGQILRYLLVYLLNYIFSIFLALAQETLGVPSWLASLNIVILAVISIYLALNFWVFRDGKLPNGESAKGAGV
jgi:putative flippase GtrA